MPPEEMQKENRSLRTSCLGPPDGRPGHVLPVPADETASLHAARRPIMTSSCPTDAPALLSVRNRFSLSSRETASHTARENCRAMYLSRSGRARHAPVPRASLNSRPLHLRSRNARHQPCRSTHNMHHPFGLMGPSTTWQVFDAAMKCWHELHFCSPLGCS